MSSLLVSVLMTAYNREKYIAEAIESIQQSTFQEWELIIVDDCSTDETVNIAKKYAADDHRISVYINEKNLGDYPNRKYAASYAKGKYIMYVDSDDKILEDGFSDCISAMEAFPDAGIGIQLHENKPSPPFYLTAEQALHRHFFENSCLTIGPGGTILRRNFFEKIGKYPELYGPANDMYFNLKAVAAGGVLFLPFDFNYYRIHEGQEINNKYSYLYNNFKYLRDALDQLELPLTSGEKKWLHNKNRRRFLVNLVRYLKVSGNLGKTMAARRLAEFGLKDFLKALLH